MFPLFVLSGSAPVADFLPFLTPEAVLKEAIWIPPPLSTETTQPFEKLGFFFGSSSNTRKPNFFFSMQGKILFTYLLLCKQQVDGARLLEQRYLPAAPRLSP